MSNNIISKKQALQIIGGLGLPNKMPGKSWNISAFKCSRGSILRNDPNSTCHNCYALKGRYIFKNVKTALERRLEKFKDPQWVDAMIFLIKDEKYFRWFDSGDLQSVDMLNKIIKVCENTPNCKHWLPTKEYNIVRKFIADGGIIPDNLCLRISADKKNEYPIVTIRDCQISTSSHNNKYDFINCHNCPVAANKNIKTCKDAKCTACWDKSVYHINYKIH